MVDYTDSVASMYVQVDALDREGAVVTPSGAVEDALPDNDGFRLTITHESIDSADRDALLTFYAANRAAMIAVPGPNGATYEGYFDLPHAIRRRGADEFDARITLTCTEQA